MMEALAQIITAVAAISGVWTVRSRLDTWKEQLKRKTENEQVRKILRQAFKIRDWIRRIRAASLTAAANVIIQELEKRRAYEDSTEIEFVGLAQFDLEILEGEVLFGEEI